MSAVEALETTTISVDPKLDAAPSPDDIDHIVCCRELMEGEGPIFAFCGLEQDRNDSAAFSDNVCEACDKIGQALYKYEIVGTTYREWRTCIRDGSNCPTGEEADQLWLKVTEPD